MEIINLFDRIRFFFLKREAQRWQAKMLLVVEYLWQAPANNLMMKDGRVIRYYTKPLEILDLDNLDEWEEKFIITLDNKPVLEVVEKFGGNDDYDPYDTLGYRFKIIRFHYGSWVSVVWKAYEESKKLKEKREMISQKALFQPLDE